MSERCGRCNRKLTDDISKQLGFGPVCWSKLVSNKEAKKDQGKLFDDPLPFRNDVILKRDDNGAVVTNVPHKIVNHSPVGFDWGYGGSGPADLALNILLLFTDKRTAEELHQVFKWDYIAKVPYSGCTIRGSEIKRWIREHRNIA